MTLAKRGAVTRWMTFDEHHHNSSLLSIRPRTSLRLAPEESDTMIEGFPVDLC